MRPREKWAIVRFLMRAAYMCTPQQSISVPKSDNDCAFEFLICSYKKAPFSFYLVVWLGKAQFRFVTISKFGGMG